ncbi:hypothetical protein [Hymenobacter weizhouensis]|uniref:hypothetical protein n=1 Tax=Hymenobacter sp. YIM 151500-1 TaxID=2987689 RepID=UPI002225CB88|nr:hypothetical protein [Hymenobacter sp. YIM 151500-1]UYZ61936.1 hypothetical protein OIS53_13100 [Hymenobacter sp. YIM 151500-1]
MKNLQFRPFWLALLLAAPLATLTSCDDDDPQPEEDNELITTVRYTLTPTSGTGTPVTVEWKDADGDGGAAPVIGTLRLAPNTTYNATITLLDESKSPAESITDEISKEKEDHLFVYTPAPAGLLTVTITDKDAKNLDVGLTSRVQTAAAASGTLRVVLRHQPGIKTGAANLGDTDVDATFPVTIQ